MDKKSKIPSVSVITIVKNNERLISRAIESTLKQTFQDFEYIIINDGSTDNTDNIIDRYAADEQRIKTVHMKNNVGRSMARNAGLKFAIGRYILFLDSDDYLPIKTLEELYNIAEKDNADIVFGSIKCFDNVTGIWKPNHYTEKIINRELYNFKIDKHLSLVNNHHIVGRLYKKEFLQKNKIGFSTERKNGEDVLFAFYTVFHANRISMVPQITSYFYNIGNYIGAANESKLSDARDNLLETIYFAENFGSNRLKKMMWKKGAIFASSLERAQKVYEERPNKLEEYIKTLSPLVGGVTNDILKVLPKYARSFTRALLVKNYRKALNLWIEQNNHNKKLSYTQEKKTTHNELNEFNKHNIYMQKQLDTLKTENNKLAHQLDELYNSRCWRITSLFRNKLYKLRL